MERKQAFEMGKSSQAAAAKVMALAIICVSEGGRESTIRKIMRATGWSRNTAGRVYDFMESTDSPELYVHDLADELSGHSGEYESRKIFAACMAAALTVARSL